MSNRATQNFKKKIDLIVSAYIFIVQQPGRSKIVYIIYMI